MKTITALPLLLLLLAIAFAAADDAAPTPEAAAPAPDVGGSAETADVHTDDAAGGATISLPPPAHSLASIRCKIVALSLKSVTQLLCRIGGG